MRRSSQLILAFFQLLLAGSRGSLGRRNLHTEAFRIRARIREVPLSDFAQSNGDALVMPSPSTDRAGVGDPAYHYALAALARALRPRVIVEFGTFLGVSTVTMLLNSPEDARIVTIDLPTHANPAGLTGTDLGLARVARDRCGEAFATHPRRSAVTQLRIDSRELALVEYVPYGADLIFVDGGHTTEILHADTENALRAIRPGGVIVWDDYCWFYPEVVRYLDDLSRHLDLRRIEDTNLVVHRHA
jgi:predicted O-methyltransferase YrrM